MTSKPKSHSFRSHVVILIGVALGFGIAAAFMPAGADVPPGGDARVFYFRPPGVDTPAPAWVYLLTYPLGLLRWPLGWQILVTLSILAAGLASLIWGGARWWIVVLSAPVIWNFWLGQIELFPMVGLMLGILVWRRQIHPAWLGVGWLALAAKPQVGYGPIVLLTWWTCRDRGLKVLLPASAAAAAILLLTTFLWPGWPGIWLTAVRELNVTWWDSSLWPYGLLAWPLALVPLRSKPQRRLRMVAAATLLGSPYFAYYHCATLMTLAEHPFALFLSWIPVTGLLYLENWMCWGWVLPAAFLMIDFLQVCRQWSAARRSAA